MPPEACIPTKSRPDSLPDHQRSNTSMTGRPECPLLRACSGKPLRSAQRETGSMTAQARLRNEATRRAERHRQEIGDALRERRLSAELSQAVVAKAAGMTRNRYGLLESGRLSSLTIDETNRVAGVLGLDVAIRLYPGGRPIRDAGHGRRLGTFLGWANRPLVGRVEVPITNVAAPRDRRAWDAVLFGHGERTVVELEMRLTDVQALRRRHELKRRDDPTQNFLLLIADTRHNRRVIAEFAQLFADLPRLRPGMVRTALEAGRHPPTGLLLV